MPTLHLEQIILPFLLTLVVCIILAPASKNNAQKSQPPKKKPRHTQRSKHADSCLSFREKSIQNDIQRKDKAPSLSQTPTHYSSQSNAENKSAHSSTHFRNDVSSSSNQRNDARTQLENASENGTYDESSSNHANTDKNNYRKSFLFSFRDSWWIWIIIGSVVGYLSANFYYIPIHTDNAKTLDHIYVDNNGPSPCDINTNKISIECEKCLNDKQRLETEIYRLENDIDTVNAENKNLKEELNELKTKYCKEYIDKVGVLSHELGECNVEWDSCEQLGRQKDKLDEKRVEEIKKQKKKFDLCSDQLKRYRR